MMIDDAFLSKQEAASAFSLAIVAELAGVHNQFACPLFFQVSFPSCSKIEFEYST